MKAKSVIATVAFATALAAMAAEPEDDNTLYVKPGSARGSVVIVNKQSLVEDAPFLAAIETFRDYQRYVIKWVADESAAQKATVLLFVVDEPSNLAPMTVSPEIGRGTLNVAALTNDLRSAKGVKKFLPKRAQLEMLRLMSYAFGVGGSQFSGNVLSATSIRELDFMKPTLPVDAFDNIEKSATRRGMKPEIARDYYAACEEGWAPAPTNAVQKAIWDKVHQMPKNPIPIKPETKKVER